MSDPMMRLTADGRLVPTTPEEIGQPGPAPQPAPVTIVLRSDLFRRCTDDEADKISAAIEATSSRMRELFRSVTTFRSDAPEWQTLHDAAVALFGADRAAQLLAPST